MTYKRLQIKKIHLRRWRQTEGERERERDRETGRQREEEGEERESVVNGEQRVVSEYVLGACFSGPLARLSGPQYLQLEYFLGACFSGPLQVFPDHNGYN